MNHPRIKRDLSAFLDGELGERRSREISLHLERCAGCREAVEELRLLREAVSSLPRRGLSEEGHRRLMSGLSEAAREREDEERVKRAAVIPRMATAAAVLLALLVVTIAVMTTPVGRQSVRQEGERGEEASPSVSGAESAERNAAGGVDKAGREDGGAPAAAVSQYSGELLTAIPVPHFEHAGRDYTEEQANEYSADLGTRLDFYSGFWHPSPPSDELVAEARRRCRESLEDQALRSGRDAKGLLRALDSIETAMGPKASEALPCFVEEATYRGKRVFIISCSRPDDSLLFTDSDLVSLVNLIRQSTPDGLMRSSDAQLEIAASLMPSPRFNAALPLREAEAQDVSAEACALGDFQAVLHALASENNLVSYLREVSRLDSGHLLATLFRELGSPLQISSRLLELLTMRVWMVDAASGEVLSRPSR